MSAHVCESKEGGNWCSYCGRLLPLPYVSRQPMGTTIYASEESRIRADEREKVLEALRPLVRALAVRDWTGWDEAMDRLRREVGL